MTLPDNFVETLTFIHPTEFVEILQGEDKPAFAVRWILTNEVRPVDLYCYLGSQFGRPNGIQNLLRSDSSDNLIHWEWVLRHDAGLVMIQGMNFRTEVWVSGFREESADRDAFVHQLKSQFSQSGQGMAKVREALEHWIELINPLSRLKASVSSLMEDLLSLGLDAQNDRVPDIHEIEDLAMFEVLWKERAEKYPRAFGLCFGIRSMLPVMAEAFVNLLLFILMKPDIKSDERLRESTIRQQLDIRIRNLSHTCNGFAKNVDFSHDACKQFHTLVNQRNDLLHGNVVIEKLRFNELYFLGKVPIFIEYASMWDRSLGVTEKAVGLDVVEGELRIVDNLIEYLLSCLHEDVREQVELFVKTRDLGQCLDDGRLGILFSDWLVDFIPSLEKPQTLNEGSV